MNQDVQFNFHCRRTASYHHSVPLRAKKLKTIDKGMEEEGENKRMGKMGEEDCKRVGWVEPVLYRRIRSLIISV